MNKLKIILIFVFIGAISIIGGAYFKMNSITSHENFETKIFYSAITKNINNKNVALSKFKEKWLLINFWATWCAPCREEIPDLNHLFNENKKINLIGIAIDEIEDVKKFLIETPINYESLILSDMKGVEISKSLGNDKGVLPFTVLINPNGEVQNTFYGKLDMTTLKRYLLDTVK
ncbi:TlpA family protein disulfide reductase [Nitrosomonadales bacterium]|nr:TlpA family protein disulfide reductase [Nitrosomonadales bacterium]